MSMTADSHGIQTKHPLSCRRAWTRVLPKAVIVSLAFSFVFLSFGNPQWSRWVYIFQAYVWRWNVPSFSDKSWIAPPVGHTGLWRTWWSNGKLRSEMCLGSGIRNGICREWHENGVMASEATYANNIIYGMLSMWYQSGQPSKQGAYIQGKKDGRWIEWNEKGTVVADGQYTNGKPWDGTFDFGLRTFRNGKEVAPNAVGGNSESSVMHQKQDDAEREYPLWLRSIDRNSTPPDNQPLTTDKKDSTEGKQEGGGR